ncbi:MAG: GGDEF domain-containing protein [Lachnospiraceae bacterium]|nr:GGDEF domain-containing protein [Lachnospiraceae bacterium]
MGFIKDKKENGVSLKRTFRITIILFFLITICLLLTVFRVFHTFDSMSKTTNDYIILEDAASGLMAASDYLTEEAQCYTVLGDRRKMENYFYEAECSQRRENAVSTMEWIMPDSEALKELKEAMNESLALMEREYYAMRLVLEAQGDRDIPEAVERVTLKAEDERLSSEEKQKLAAQMVHDDTYYEEKEEIRAHLNRCIDKLKSDNKKKIGQMEKRMQMGLIFITVLIVLQTLSIVLSFWVAVKLGINPILNAVEHIKNKQSLPIMGSKEFRYLANTYNSVYDAYERNIESLSYKASHDELTGVYNRTGYDLIRQNIKPETTALILVDADKFKHINDELGHKTGDRVLIKIANTLTHSFRSEDYVCRIGGDEFVVLMMHVNENSQKLIEGKVRQINEKLMDTSDGLPAISVSAGISFYRNVEGGHDAFKEADAALYSVKENGRNGFCFYDADKHGPMDDGAGESGAGEGGFGETGGKGDDSGETAGGDGASES